MDETRQLPAYTLRIVYDIIAEETRDHEALTRVLTLAGLERYADAPPPMDNTPSMTMHEYECLIAVVWQVFDYVQARDILRRTAQRGFANLTQSGMLVYTQFLRAFDALGTKRERVALAMGRLTSELTHALGNKHEFRREGEDFILDIYDCPYCAELVRNHTQLAEPHVCHTPVAFYEAALTWASGDNHTIQEISCRTTNGLEYCRFKIYWNIGLKKPL